MGSESRFLEYIPAQSIRYGYKKNIKNSVPDPDFFTFDLRISYIIGVEKKIHPDPDPHSDWIWIRLSILSGSWFASVLSADESGSLATGSARLKNPGK